MNEAIVFDRVSKRLGGRQVLQEVSFTVGRGDIFGFLGPNGAGKTTTIRIIMGLFRPESGTARVLGNSTLQDAGRQGIGFLLEADGLYENLDAEENLALYGRLYNISKTEQPGRIDEVLRLVGLSNRKKDKVAAYSKGMRQKLALARAMIHDPDLLIFDEPTAGVDPTGQMEVREIVLDLSSRGKTVFLSSHNLDEVQRICNQVALIDKGRIKVQGELARLQADFGHEELSVEVGAVASPAELEHAVDELRKLPRVTKADIEAGRIMLQIDGKLNVVDIVNILAKRNIPVEEIKKQKISLEEIYAGAIKEAE